MKKGSTAVLTIDDIVTANTPAFVDYLCQKQIGAVMFAVGQRIETHYDEAVYAVQKGMIVGNHSYSHIGFSGASYAECVEEIERTERLLEQVYLDAGKPRLYKPFRFPYGDRGQGRGQAHCDALQAYLRANHFSKLRDDQIRFPWYGENGLNQAVDAFWTFDFGEYQMADGKGFTAENVCQRIHDAHPSQGGALLEEGSHHIVLMHANDGTERVMPRYYEKILDYCMAQGVRFTAPGFVGETP